MFTSSYSDVLIPDESLYDYLFTGAGGRTAGKVALIDATTGEQTTYGALRTQVDAVAGALAARGVGPAPAPTVVGLLSPNTPGFAAAFHGVLRAGGVITPINTLYTADEIAKQLGDAGATWLITASALLGQASRAAKAVGIPDDRLIVLDGAPGHASLAGFLGESIAPPIVSFDPATHLAVLPFSSGTTGQPKGVMITHRNLVANVQQSRSGIAIASTDRVLAVLPFFHIYGMTVLLNLALRQRATLVTMPRFDLNDYLTAVELYRCTYLPIAPPIAVALAKHPAIDGVDLSSVHTVLSGAAPLDGDTATRAGQRIQARVLQGYGMTELSPVSHVVPPERDDIPVSAVGVLLPNQVCKLVDIETGREITELGPDGRTAPGELRIKGPNVMVGYLGQPESTAEAFDEDEYLRTGDVAVFHESGYFLIVDRVKELIKYKGYQIAPAELEALLLGHPSVMDAAVLGVLDDEGQEIPQAFVVRVPGSDLDAATIMSYVADAVAPHKKVRRVAFVDAIPKSASGKILRRELRARATST